MTPAKATTEDPDRAAIAAAIRERARGSARAMLTSAERRATLDRIRESLRLADEGHPRVTWRNASGNPKHWESRCYRDLTESASAVADRLLDPWPETDVCTDWCHDLHDWEATAP
jgi:hypothetical protein